MVTHWWSIIPHVLKIDIRVIILPLLEDISYRRERYVATLSRSGSLINLWAGDRGAGSRPTLNRSLGSAPFRGAVGPLMRSIHALRTSNARPRVSVRAGDATPNSPYIIRQAAPCRRPRPGTIGVGQDFLVAASGVCHSRRVLNWNDRPTGSGADRSQTPHETISGLVGLREVHGGVKVYWSNGVARTCCVNSKHRWRRADCSSHADRQTDRLAMWHNVLHADPGIDRAVRDDQPVTQVTYLLQQAILR